MRILIVNWSIRNIAGTEDYLSNVMPELRARGNELAFAYEVDLPQSRKRIVLPEGTPSWNLAELGMGQTLRNMKAWEPDLIYAHGLLAPRFEAGFLDIAPSIYFAHNYYGTCISGLKTFKFPTVRPCSRRFGSACLLYYFPRRCGGRSPITMWKLFRRESRRLTNLGKYQAIVTHSTHMRDEYVRNGLLPDRVHNFVYEITSPKAQNRLAPSPFPMFSPGEPASAQGCWNLLFVGRMELLKGGATLLDALPAAFSLLNRPILLRLAGDGPDRKSWEEKAARLQAKYPALKFEFAGWVDKERLESIYSKTDLLVVPSLWPEPFGRIGPEAGLHGVPVAAFAVGGVEDWLKDGVNGFLASGDPPTAAGLAIAIARCLSHSSILQHLRVGAVEVAQQFNMAHHLQALEKVFAQVCSASPNRSPIAAG